MKKPKVQVDSTPSVVELKENKKTRVSVGVEKKKEKLLEGKNKSGKSKKELVGKKRA